MECRREQEDMHLRRNISRSGARERRNMEGTIMRISGYSQENRMGGRIRKQVRVGETSVTDADPDEDDSVVTERLMRRRLRKR